MGLECLVSQSLDPRGRKSAQATYTVVLHYWLETGAQVDEQVPGSRIYRGRVLSSSEVPQVNIFLWETIFISGKFPSKPLVTCDPAAVGTLISCRPLAPWPQRSLLILRSENRCRRQKAPAGRCGFPTLVICTPRTNPTLSESHHFSGLDFRSTGDEKFSLKWKSARVFYDFMTQCGHPWVWYEGCSKIFRVSSPLDVSQVLQFCHQVHLPQSVWYPLQIVYVGHSFCLPNPCWSILFARGSWDPRFHSFFAGGSQSCLFPVQILGIIAFCLRNMTFIAHFKHINTYSKFYTIPIMTFQSRFYARFREQEPEVWSLAQCCPLLTCSCFCYLAPYRNNAR